MVEPSAQTPLPIHVVGSAGLVRAQSWIRISGLPLLASLSEGYAIAPGLWKVPLASLDRLAITAPSGDSIRSYVDIALISPDGIVLTEVRSVFAILEVSQLLPTVSPPASDAGAVCPSWAVSRSRLQDVADASVATRFEHENAGRAQRLAKIADASMTQGNLAAARSLYQRAAEFGWSQAAFALAAAYDPHELPRWNGVAIGADANLARCWYERARQLANVQAAVYLMRLDPGRATKVRNAQNVNSGAKP